MFPVKEGAWHLLAPRALLPESKGGAVTEILQR
jgi:hypothetical protein